VFNACGYFGVYMWVLVVNNVVAIVGLVGMFFWIGGFDWMSNLYLFVSWMLG